MSIVGVDKHALAFYRDKHLSEQLVDASGIPYTILCATQFHSFIARLFVAQRRLPIVDACGRYHSPEPSADRSATAFTLLRYPATRT